MPCKSTLVKSYREVVNCCGDGNKCFRSTYIAVSQTSDGLDVHYGICNKLLEFRESRGVVVPDELKAYRLGHWTEVCQNERTLFTMRISFSTSTDRLFACTIRVYSGFRCAGRAMISGGEGFAL